MPCFLGVILGLLRSAGALMISSLRASAPAASEVAAAAAEVSPAIPTPSRTFEQRLQQGAIANFYRNMGRLDQLQGTAARAYAAIKQHNFEKVRRADNRYADLLDRGARSNGKSCRGASPLPQAQAGPWPAEEEMDLRVESPTYNNHYHLPPKPSNSRGGCLMVSAIVAAVALGAGGMLVVGSWKQILKFVERREPTPQVNVEVPPAPPGPRYGLGLWHGEAPTAPIPQRKDF